MHGGNSMRIEPRGWQSDALTKYKVHEDICFLIDATPGSGKTYFSGFCFQHIVETHPDAFLVAVVPTTVLKNSFQESYHNLGIELTTSLKTSRPNEFQGAAVTYQQLSNLVTVFEKWHEYGQKLVFVFDEIHHASEENQWGDATVRCSNIATSIIAMSGTPFRGDNRKIACINYDDDGVAISDTSYTYRKAVSEKVCRPVFFIHDDGDAEYYFGLKGSKTLNETKISDSDNKEVGKVSRVIFDSESTWLEKTFLKADQKLDAYRTFTNDAGGIIVCQPGYDENATRYINKIAPVVRKLTGQNPVVISYEDPDADAKIEAFDRSGDKWILAVRKISEGVDIKRLRVMLMLSAPSTELLFRQLVGRVVRVINKDASEDSSVFMAKFPHMVDWVDRILEEAAQGLKDREERQQRESGGMDDDNPYAFSIKGCTHEDGGGTSLYGDRYDAAEIIYAEKVKKAGGSIISATSIPEIAKIIKVLGHTPPEPKKETEPLQKRKERKRKEIDKLVKALAHKANKTKDTPDYAKVRMWLNKTLRVKSIEDLCNNHSIEKMDSAINLLNKNLMEI
jgi:superfamily II DNA or RNA helicase